MALSFYMSKMAFEIIKSEYLSTPNNKTVSDKLNNLETNFSKIVALTFLGGAVSGMVGIGGGMITTPLMLGLGAEPKVNN